MIIFSRRIRSASKLICLVGLGIVLGVLCLPGSGTQTAQILTMNRADQSAAYSTTAQGPTTAASTVVLDALRLSFDPRKRVEFLVTGTRNTSIFVLATGVQVRTPSGWKTEAEQSRGEIWRLKAGVSREVCVDRPTSETWRAYVRYGTEMKGLSLLRAQLRAVSYTH